MNSLEIFYCTVVACTTDLALKNNRYYSFNFHLCGDYIKLAKSIQNISGERN